MDQSEERRSANQLRQECDRHMVEGKDQGRGQRPSKGEGHKALGWG